MIITVVMRNRWRKHSIFFGRNCLHITVWTILINLPYAQMLRLKWGHIAAFTNLPRTVPSVYLWLNIDPLFLCSVSTSPYWRLPVFLFLFRMSSSGIDHTASLCSCCLCVSCCEWLEWCSDCVAYSEFLFPIVSSVPVVSLPLPVPRLPFRDSGSYDDGHTYTYK